MRTNGWGNPTHARGLRVVDAVVQCPTRSPFNGCGRRRAIVVGEVARSGRWPECCGQVMEMIDHSPISSRRFTVGGVEEQPDVVGDPRPDAEIIPLFPDPATPDTPDEVTPPCT